jgi:predicted nucleic acid-binding protein
MAPEPRIFLDTSAIFAGIWSSAGGGRMILKLGEAGALQLITSRDVLGELERVFRRKAPELLGELALVLDRARLEIGPSPPKQDVERNLDLVGHLGDANIIAAARNMEVDYFVTLDRKHFIDNMRLVDEVPFPVGIPGDMLDWYRRELTNRRS